MTIAIKKFKGDFGHAQTPNILPKFLTKEEVLAILENAKKDKIRNYIMLQFLWRTGVRVGELVKIRKEDIKEGNIYIKQGKGKKDRVIPLQKGLDDILGFYLDSLKPKNKLFPIGVRQVRNVINKYLPKGIKAHPHTFRHSFAVNCLLGGMNIRSLQKILGHKSLEHTSIYLDITAKNLKEDMDKVVF
jgi:site-specific recombinase XerD